MHVTDTAKAGRCFVKHIPRWRAGMDDSQGRVKHMQMQLIRKTPQKQM